jgi:tRNA-dihydrouridine synthase B
MIVFPPLPVPTLPQPAITLDRATRKVHLFSKVMLAPMAGVTDIVFRGLVRRWAPQSLICTEMISSNGLVQSRKAKKKRDEYILQKTDQDTPIAYQLAAHKPDVLLEAAEALIAEKDPDTIDLNMGCPVKKITGNFEGCALMKEPDTAFALIQHLTKHLDRPVTVKFRLGWDSNSMNYLEFGKRCEDAGASMVVLHARTRAQGYQPGCKWEAYGELKQALSIPVIANGDINTVADAQHIITTYGVDGVMLGRACLGEPWLIGQLDAALTPSHSIDRLDFPETVAQRMAVALEHAQYYVDARSRHALMSGLRVDPERSVEEMALREMRKHLAWYAKGFRGANVARQQLTSVTHLTDISRIIGDIIATLSANGSQQDTGLLLA